MCLTRGENICRAFDCRIYCRETARKVSTYSIIYYYRNEYWIEGWRQCALALFLESSTESRYLYYIIFHYFLRENLHCGAGTNRKWLSVLNSEKTFVFHSFFTDSAFPWIPWLLHRASAGALFAPPESAAVGNLHVVFKLFRRPCTSTVAAALAPLVRRR